MSQALTTAQITVLNKSTPLPLLAAVAVKFAVVVTKWDQNRKTRRHLRQLEPHLLKDIGLDAHTAHQEAAKPFWFH